ncbi:hypothetical protein FQA39_LY08523 [Lamprigera yunnana]|nr:hypothetical protein FQA39_LY08523 [Lamprigera yunnana]
MNKNCPIIVAASGFVVLFFGIISSWYVFPKVVEYAINQKIALTEGNEVYELWKKQPFPLKLKVYFFNVTNAEDVQQGSKPMLKEIGPYVYDEYWERVSVNISEENDTISYMLKRSFFFNSTDSGCRLEDDPVIMVNGALVSTALQVNMILPSAVATVNEAIPYLYKGAKDVFIRATAKDILFEGILITCHDPEVEFICGAMKGMLPPTIEFINNGTDFKFSLFGYMNKSLAGPFVIGRGIKNTTRGDIYEYKGSRNLGIWQGPTCNMINGSDTTLFYPMKTPPEKIYAFSPDICRSMYVSYEKNDVYEGIPTWRYVNRPEVVAKSKENECFCPKGKDENYNEVFMCPKGGLVDITYCVKGPILISNPHFYLGDPSLVEYARGVNPKKELHENYLFIEPITGSPLAGVKRLQMNVELKKFKDFDLLNNVSEGIFPMIWIEEGALVPPKYRHEIAGGLTQLGLLDAFKWVLIVGGIGLVILSFLLVMYKEKLMCFANAGLTNKVSITEVKEIKENKEQDINTIMYPTMYPQINNNNKRNQYVRRKSSHELTSTAFNMIS